MIETIIDFNTVREKQKELFKLINDAVCGKSLDDVRKRINFHLVSDKQRLLKLVSTPWLKRMLCFTDDVADVSLRMM